MYLFMIDFLLEAKLLDEYHIKKLEYDRCLEKFLKLQNTKVQQQLQQPKVEVNS